MGPNVRAGAKHRSMLPGYKTMRLPLLLGERAIQPSNFKYRLLQTGDRSNDCSPALALCLGIILKDVQLVHVCNRSWSQVVLGKTRLWSLSPIYLSSTNGKYTIKRV